MGNPLSPLLAEIFMDNIEKTIHKHLLSKHFPYWYRYVDDIIVCFTGTNRQFTVFKNFIKNLHPKIKFTSEIEQNNSINFLDLTITRSNNKQFLIYHKPSHTDITIHYTSAHLYQHKVAAFNSYIHRLLNTPKNLHPKIKFTSEIEQNNSINFLDLTITRSNNKHQFLIYHKPSHTDITIHYTSAHPYQHKVAAFNSYIHRLLNTPMSNDNYFKELNLIKQIAINNGYDAYYIT
ncbi:hypothetical protein HHI36_006654 [Cryptolaemus montrouzieri]|uniref:Reverse transcriptase domain-containing protein n=1 Tax=Cryptolaemus montrouzieri TaxID=559131 RepID=A0ABD2NXU6_9CUCU